MPRPHKPSTHRAASGSAPWPGASVVLAQWECSTTSTAASRNSSQLPSSGMRGWGQGGLGTVLPAAGGFSRVRSIACLRTKKAPSQSPSNHAQTRSSSGRAEQNRRLKYRYTGECFQRRIAHPGLHEYAENKKPSRPCGCTFHRQVASAAAAAWGAYALNWQMHGRMCIAGRTAVHARGP